jgi:fructuronate reductase
VRAAAEGLAGDVVPTLPSDLDAEAYRVRLGERWSNARIEHALEQIAKDGDRKLPARFRDVAQERLADGVVPRHVALVLAAWGLHRGTADAREIIDPTLFGEGLASSEGLHDAVAEWLARFDADGIRGALRAAA